jgi:two-component system nitrogen regulation response regulator GlnG
MPLLRRLEAYTMAVPPLRERRDDVARLFHFFLERELTNLGEQHKLDEPEVTKRPWLPTALVFALMQYEWPGNVAELQTVARRIAVSNRGQRKLVLDDWVRARLPLFSRDSDRPGAKPSTDPILAEPAPAPPRGDARTLEDRDIVAAMRAARFRIARAAEALGVSRSWLHTRLEFCVGVRHAKDLTREEILKASTRVGANLQQLAELLEVSEHGLKLRMTALGLAS